ncbi:Gamma-glutamyl hydrolase 1 [Striga hermonthica]|uniref:Gamma-glutamyl hydrolase 1 n=1 Tax=Striga hermonthica TaxID=68872 RepID=A0A9N7RJU5_STRHE|nr:Gamma-glutamyl hydrolase 1 [Striga hermonthica]
MAGVPYSSGVRSLMYAMVCTRPDIAHAVGIVSRYLSNPGKDHWEAVKWILRYQKDSANKSLSFDKGNPILEGYTDADMAEYIALTEAGKDLLWFKRFLQQLGMKQEMYDIHCDSQSALDLSKNAMYHSRTKHIDVKYHWLRQAVEEQQFRLEKIYTDDNPADMMTKVKNAFEWGLSMIPHSEDAVEVTQLVAKFIVREARKSKTMPSLQSVRDNLIYKYRTIVRVLNKHYGDEAPVVGSLTTLYNGLRNLDSGLFSSDDCKNMLLNPIRSSEVECRRLKINIGDTPPTSGDGVFIASKASLIITDDLQVLPNTTGFAVQIFHNLGIMDTIGIEERSLTYFRQWICDEVRNSCATC